MELYNNFNKKFNFKNENYQLPSIEIFYSTEIKKYEPLQIIKAILNFVKSKLNDYKLEEWSEHTRRRNPAQQIIYHLKNTIKGEFVTQAFAKFFECVNSYQLVHENVGDKFFSVHLCEAPGAFITSLNHYLKLNHPQTEFVWRATTLNPYYEGNSLSNTILDDRFILHTLPNWYFGDTYSGDILNENNIKSLVEYCKRIGKVDLVTCDGSIDCVSKPEEQEEHVSMLHAAEFITSLALLSDGGSMVIKLFTFYELSTVSLLFVMNCCFENVHVFKPATSKNGNSEVYVIGLKFKKDSITNEHINHLIKNFKANGKSMLPLESIPQNFLDQVTNAARFFMNQQVSVIENNIRNFKKHDKREFDRIKTMKLEMVEEYIRQYRMRPIDESKKILHGITLGSGINLNERVHRGSHSERLLFQNVSKNEQLHILYDRLRELFQRVLDQPLLPYCKTLKIDARQICIENFIKITRGKPIERIASSKFITVSVFKFFNELRAFMGELIQEEGTYKGNNFIFHNDNHLSLEMEYFRRSENYDTYEKDVIAKILNHIYDKKCEIFSIEALPLFTQFLVGVILFLALFVFKEIYLDRYSNNINFLHLRNDGLLNLKLLINAFCEDNLFGIIAICDTKILFTSNQEFYKSIIDYNNHLCLRLCSFYLNNISN